MGTAKEDYEALEGEYFIDHENSEPADERYQRLLREKDFAIDCPICGYPASFAELGENCLWCDHILPSPNDKNF